MCSKFSHRLGPRDGAVSNSEQRSGARQVERHRQTLDAETDGTDRRSDSAMLRTAPFIAAM
jgi:hypothetical protein